MYYFFFKLGHWKVCNPQFCGFLNLSLLFRQKNNNRFQFEVCLNYYMENTLCGEQFLLLTKINASQKLGRLNFHFQNSGNYCFRGKLKIIVLEVKLGIDGWLQQRYANSAYELFFRGRSTEWGSAPPLLPLLHSPFYWPFKENLGYY